MPKEGYLYFIRERDHLTDEIGPYVKIGLTRDVRPVAERISDHKTGNPRDEYSEYDLHVPMVDHLEKYLHHYFADQRISGEWFLMSTDEALNVAVPVAQKVAAEQAITKPGILNLDLLKVSQSNGKTRKATPHETTLHQKYIVADKAIKTAKAEMKILDSELRSMVGNANGIERVLVLQQKNQSDVLDQDGFMSELSEEQLKLCQSSSMTGNGNPSIMGKISLRTFDKELDEKVKLAAKNHPSKFPLSNKQNAPRAITDDIKATHMEFLRSKRAIKTLEWEMRQIEVELANSLGSDDEIERVIRWQRSQPEEQTGFSKSEAKKHFAELFAKHCTPRPDHIAVKIAEGHPYHFHQEVI
jgi:hypothetical protein